MANRVDPSHLLALQQDVDRIRNFCILAHVDHGKTTLSDSLVSSNGIISPRLAGKLRFLDSTEEEQKRGITMHSSAIALLYRLEDKGGEAGKETNKEDFLVNLVDCPGHIDFSSDVSTAARLCDGALIVVDVLEGVCTQTHAVIYKALRERMKPCLVLNKLDRLIVESKLSPTEAFHHLRRLIEQVNALSFMLVKSELLKQAMESDPNFTEFVLDDTHPLLAEWTFSPDKNNLQFASALDGWGFGLMKCINMLTKKLGLNRNILRQYLFEDYYINLETKKIGKYGGSDSSKSPMFANLVLEPIWEIYDCALVRGDLQELGKMATETLGLAPLPPRELNPRDMRASLQAVMRRHMPLAESLLRMVVKVLPSPKEGQERRIDTLLPLDFYGAAVLSGLPSLPHTPSSPVLPPAVPTYTSTPVELTPPLQRIYEDIKTCSRGAEGALVVFVSKMMPVRASELSKADWAMLKSASADGDGSGPRAEEEVFMAVGRVFSGTLTRTGDLYVIGHKVRGGGEDGEKGPETDEYAASPSLVSAKRVTRVTGGIGLYLLLGPSVYPADEVGAGNIVGIVGLEPYILKSATLSNLPYAFPLRPISFQARPMLKVAVEPNSHLELKSLELGLQCLNQFDPVVEVQLEDNGQWTLTCLGELHLDQCVKVLKEKFVKKSEIKVSEPLISFRETVLVPSPATPPPSLPPPWADMPHLSAARAGRVSLSYPGAGVAIHFRVVPLPKAVAGLEGGVGIGMGTGNEVGRLDEFLTSYYLHTQTTRKTVAESIFSTNKSLESVWKTLIEKMREEIKEGAEKGEGGYKGDMGGWAELGSADKLDNFIESVLSIGPRACPSNLLYFAPNMTFEIYHTLPEESIANPSPAPAPALSTRTPIVKFTRQASPRIGNKLWGRLHSGVAAGFQEVGAGGPLMAEPLWCVGVGVEKVELAWAWVEAVLSAEEKAELLGELTMVSDTTGGDAAKLQEDDAASVASDKASQSADRTVAISSLSTGQLISDSTERIKLALLSMPLRIVEPIYSCDLQCDQT
eukprot:gene32612-39430_t